MTTHRLYTVSIIGPRSCVRLTYDAPDARAAAEAALRDSRVADWASVRVWRCAGAKGEREPVTWVRADKNAPFVK